MDALEEIWKAVKNQFPDIFTGCCVPTPTDFPLFRDGMCVVYASDNKDDYKECVVPLAGTILCIQYIYNIYIYIHHQATDDRPKRETLSSGKYI